MDQKTNHLRLTWIWLIAVIGLGVCARFAITLAGHNYDYDSYRVVADLTAQGNNVYAGTTRYNYGPVWFNVIHLLNLLAGGNAVVFRWLLVGLLSAVDVGIFYILWWRFGKAAATMFLLNPVSIIITGYTNQFDNLAILVGLCAMLVFGDDFDRPVGRRKFFGLLLLGLSLMTKHLFFIFPFWLAVKQKGIFQKILVLLVPVAVFLASFAPYWPAGGQGIIHNVFLYRSMQNHYLYSFFLPVVLQNAMSSQTFWFICLALFALVCRKRDALESLIFYTAVLVAASPAISIQYLTIPLVFIATRINCLTVIYTILATAVLAFHPNCLRLSGLPPMFPNIPLYILALAIAWSAWQPQIAAAGRFLHAWFKAEIENQLGLGKK
jgi:hypothetical protein